MTCLVLDGCNTNFPPGQSNQQFNEFFDEVFYRNKKIETAQLQLIDSVAVLSFFP